MLTDQNDSASVFEVTLSSSRRSALSTTVIAVVGMTFCSGPVVTMALLPEGFGWWSILVGLTAGWVVGLIPAAAIVALSLGLAHRFEWLRSTSTQVQRLTLSAEGIQSPSIGAVPWSKVLCFLQHRDEDGNVLSPWLLELHNGGTWQLHLAGSDATRADDLLSAIDTHRDSAYALNPDGSPPYFYAWRIRQSVWTVFERVPAGASLLSPLIGLVVTGSISGTIVFALFFSFLVWLSWFSVVSHLFLFLTGYERNRLYRIENGVLMDEMRRPLLALGTSAWEVRQQRWTLGETRPVLTFWQGRRKRLELVMPGLDHLSPEDQPALMHCLRSTYAHQELPAPDPDQAARDPGGLGRFG